MVVYNAGAMVTRVATNVSIQESGFMVFDSLPLAIDKMSIQANSSDGVKIISVRSEVDTKVVVPDHAQKEKLALAQEAVMDSIAILTTLSSRVSKEIAVIEKNDNFSTDQGVNMDGLARAAELYRNELRALDLEKLQYEREIKQLGKRKFRLMKANQALVQNTTQYTKVIVQYERARTVAADVEVTYYVAGATWTSMYDLRMSDGTDGNALEHKATITQATGEDWNNVNLTLSNRSPNTRNVTPRLVPAILGQSTDRRNFGARGSEFHGIVRDALGEPLIGASVIWKGSRIGTVTDIHGIFSIPNAASNTLVISYVGFETREIGVAGLSSVEVILNEGSLLDEVVVTGARDGAKEYYIDGIRAEKRKSLSVTKEKSLNSKTYTIAKKMRIPSDSKGYEIMIESSDCSLDYQYVGFPEQGTAAYLKAGLIDWRSYELNAGQINTFLNGRYMGKSNVNPHQSSDTLWMAMGEDTEIKISREVIKEFSKKSFFKNKTIDKKTFDIEVTNNKSSTVAIDVFDQVPISNTDDVDVKVIEVSGAMHQKESGYLNWSMSLAPFETKKVRVSYEIKYGKNIDLVDIQ